MRKFDFAKQVVRQLATIDVREIRAPGVGRPTKGRIQNDCAMAQLTNRICIRQPDGTSAKRET